MNDELSTDWIDDILDEDSEYDDINYEIISEEFLGDVSWVRLSNSTQIPQLVLSYGRSIINTFGAMIMMVVLSMDHFLTINKHSQIHSAILHNEHPC